jgi:hypothetical protein
MLDGASANYASAASACFACSGVAGAWPRPSPLCAAWHVGLRMNDGAALPTSERLRTARSRAEWLTLSSLWWERE